MATIRQRGKRWQAIIKRKGHPLLSQSFDLKRDAEKWARHQERQMDAGQWIDRTEAEQTTLADLLERYGREVTVSKRGAAVETIRINVLKRSTLARHAVAAITGQLVANWRDSRLKEVSGSTVARELSLLSHVFTVAIREWSFGLQCNPVALIRKPRLAPPRDRILTDDQRTALLAALDACRNPWIKPIVVLALETACRRGEILSLSWSEVDLKRCVARVSGKTGTRTVPLSPKCHDVLAALPRTLDGRVFPVTVDALKQAYERAVSRAGIVDFTFHDLRHDALTRLAKRGFSILELRAISGHTTANMLQRYVSIDASELAVRLAS